MAPGRNVNFFTENRGLKIFGKDNGRMPNTGLSCLSSAAKVLRRFRSGTTSLQTKQKTLGRGHKRKTSGSPRCTLRSTTEYQMGSDLSPECRAPTTSCWKAEGMPDLTTFNSLLALKSGVGVSFLWKTTESLLSWKKQTKKQKTKQQQQKKRRKHLQKTWNLKELRSCLLKKSRAQDISKRRAFAFV